MIFMYAELQSALDKVYFILLEFYGTKIEEFAILTLYFLIV